MAEFWEEEAVEERKQMGKQALKWGLLFLLLCGGLFFALWWASSAVRFSSSRVQANTGATYRVFGVVKDALSGAPVAWAEIVDEPSGHPPHFQTTADRFGVFELSTIAEPHYLLVNALGYRQERVRIGQAWYTWMPKGEEKKDIALLKE